MRITKKHLQNIQIELFYSQLNALAKQDQELLEHFNIARNLACSEWDYGLIPSSYGGRDGLRIAKTFPSQMELLRSNLDKQREEISYRRYALIKAYYPIIKNRIDGTLADCLDYWEEVTEIN
jgi:hypothetical protein